MSFSRVRAVIRDWFHELVEFVMVNQPNPRYLFENIANKIETAEMWVKESLRLEYQLAEQIENVRQQIKDSSLDAALNTRLRSTEQKKRKEQRLLLRELGAILNQFRKSNDKLLSRLDYFRDLNARLHFLIIVSAPIPEFAETDEFEAQLALKKLLEFLFETNTQFAQYSKNSQFSYRIEKWELVALESLQFLSTELLKKSASEVEQHVRVISISCETLSKEERKLIVQRENLVDNALNSKSKLFTTRPWLLAKRLRIIEKHLLRLEIYQLLLQKLELELAAERKSVNAGQ